ncbi:MAG: hypothetical protein R3194_10190 [Limnobacter sp.]|nr:hypothetical protein [Limnobacter sp.]
MQGSDLARITNYVNATRKEGDDTARSIAGKWPSWKQVKLTLASEAQTALRAEPVRSLARRASGDSLDSDATPRIRNSELALSRSQNKGPDPTKAQEGLASRLYRAFRVIVRSYAYSIANWVQQVAASTNQPTIAIGAKGKQIALTASDRLVQLFSQALQTLVNALGYGLNHPTTDPRTRPQ